MQEVHQVRGMPSRGFANPGLGSAFASSAGLPPRPTNLPPGAVSHLPATLPPKPQPHHPSDVRWLRGDVSAVVEPPLLEGWRAKALRTLADVASTVSAAERAKLTAIMEQLEAHAVAELRQLWQEKEAAESEARWLAKELQALREKLIPGMGSEEDEWDVAKKLRQQHEEILDLRAQIVLLKREVRIGDPTARFGSVMFGSYANYARQMEADEAACRAAIAALEEDGVAMLRWGYTMSNNALTHFAGLPAARAFTSSLVPIPIPSVMPPSRGLPPSPRGVMQFADDLPPPPSHSRLGFRNPSPVTSRRIPKQPPTQGTPSDVTEVRSPKWTAADVVLAPTQPPADPPLLEDTTHVVLPSIAPTTGALGDLTNSTISSKSEAPAALSPAKPHSKLSGSIFQSVDSPLRPSRAPEEGNTTRVLATPPNFSWKDLVAKPPIFIGDPVPALNFSSHLTPARHTPVNAVSAVSRSVAPVDGRTDSPVLPGLQSATSPQKPARSGGIRNTGVSMGPGTPAEIEDPFLEYHEPEPVVAPPSPPPLPPPPPPEPVDPERAKLLSTLNKAMDVLTNLAAPPANTTAYLDQLPLPESKLVPYKPPQRSMAYVPVETYHDDSLNDTSLGGAPYHDRSEEDIETIDAVPRSAPSPKAADHEEPAVPQESPKKSPRHNQLPDPQTAVPTITDSPVRAGVDATTPLTPRTLNLKMLSKWNRT